MRTVLRTLSRGHARAAFRVNGAIGEGGLPEPILASGGVNGLGRRTLEAGVSP